MARRLSWVGSHVMGVIEILPYPSGLSRNISQCLNDFNIPLYLNHIITKICGKDRVKGVEVCALRDGIPDKSKKFFIECDTVLLAVGLIPENELSKKMGIFLNQDTGGPYVDSNYMTNIEGVFACGNVLHVHDLIDLLSEESKKCAGFVYEYIKKEYKYENQYDVKAGSNVIYVIPNKYVPDRKNTFYFRPFIVKNNARLIISIGNKVIKEIKLAHVRPSEMICISLKKIELDSNSEQENNLLEISLQ